MHCERRRNIEEVIVGECSFHALGWIQTATNVESLSFFRTRLFRFLVLRVLSCVIKFELSMNSQKNIALYTFFYVAHIFLFVRPLLFVRYVFTVFTSNMI